jgi:hypothetical protein
MANVKLHSTLLLTGHQASSLYSLGASLLLMHRNLPLLLVSRGKPTDRTASSDTYLKKIVRFYRLLEGISLIT